ncbi:MAG: DNA-binding response regulator [Clostridiales bacterium]|nr:MAG: DNA-binding response regulator [Clostridiales bacterium]
MRIYVLEDHPLMIKALQSIIESAFEGATIITENSLGNAISNIGYVDYDLAIVDLNLSGEKSFDFIERAKKAHVNAKFLVFTSSIRKDFFERANALQVDGYLVKECMPEDLIYAIKTVLKNRKYIDPIFYEEQEDIANVEELSSREREVLKLIGKGLTNSEIANELYISVSTVKKHASSAMAKMNFANRTVAALYCQTHYV